MSAVLSTPKTTSGGEIIRELVNASDGQGLHFDGAAGNIDIASPPDLGTKFSFEFIIQADSWGSADHYLVDFGNGGRFVFASSVATSYNLGLFDNASWKSFGVKVLDDLKVHHLTVTIDGTAAILYDNGNQAATVTISAGHGIDLCTDARIASANDGPSQLFNGTIYRARFWNKTLSQAEVTASYENATVPFADQYGSQTEKITNAVDRNFIGGSSNWVNSGCDTFDDTDDLSITTSATADFVYLPNAFWTKAAGKRFRLEFEASAMSGDGFKVAIGVSNQTIVETVSSGANSADFIYDGSGNGNLFIAPLGNSASGITFDNFSVREIGCVADYDLAFAQPEISFTVQNRNSTISSDGEVSNDGTNALGVTQVTPIEQLNSKSARIGTSAATPADGELLVSGNVEIGASPENAVSAATLQIDAPFSSSPNGIIRLSKTGTNTSGGGSAIQFDTSKGATDVNYFSKIEGRRTSANDGSSDLAFYTTHYTTSPAAVERLTISSAGNVGIGGPPEASGSQPQLHITDGGAIDPPRANVALEISRTSAASDDVYLGIQSGNTGKAGIVFGDSDDDAQGYIEYDNDTNKLIFNTNKLTIDSAGDATFTGAVNSNFFTMADASVVRWGAGTATYIQGSQSAEYINFIVNSSNKGGFSSTGLDVNGGIVETNGVLKSNLLTNSGFDVWSNSTLEDATGTNLVSAWTNSPSYSYSDFDPDGANITKAEQTVSQVASIAYSAISVTAGKLYEVSFTCTLASGVLPSVYVAVNTTATSGAVAQAAVAGAQTIVFEALSDSNYIAFRTGNTELTEYAISSFTLKEVTPGCVAADSLGQDGWVKRTAVDLYRQHDDATLTKDGSFYSLKGVSSTSLWQTYWPTASSDPLHIARFAGRTVTFGAWVYSTLATPEVHLRIDDGGTSDSTQTVAQNTWTWLECTKTISTSAGATFQIAKSGATAETFYVSQVMLVLGSAIGSGNYSRPSGEIVNCEAVARVRDGTSPLAADDEIMNLEALSSGKIPKGAKAVFLRTLLTNSSITSGQGVRFSVAGVYPQLDNCPTVNSVRSTSSGRVGCDSNGDIYQEINEAGATLSDYYVDVTAVELR